MTQPATVARPYAKALFAVAQKGGDAVIAQWQSVLKALAQVVGFLQSRDLVNHPKLQADLLGTICLDAVVEICGGFDAGQRELLRDLLQLLVQRKRLMLAPEIASQFLLLSSEAAGMVNATITSHAPLEDAQKTSLSKALEQRFSCKVSVTCEEDPTLLGGAVIRVGDWVVDHTVRRHLNRLEALLT